MDKVKEVTKFSGLNLRQDPSNLQDNELVKLTNFDISRKPGSLSLRRGKEFLYTVSAANLVRQVAKVNGSRYQVAGDVLYRDGQAITYGLSPENETNFQAFRPLDDTAIWAFIADDNFMIKDDGSRLFLWGIDLIPTPKPQLCNQTGKSATDTVTAGTYSAAVTQIRWDTSEGN